MCVSASDSLHGQVDADALRLPDYYGIVTKPMDLGTVKSNLEGQKYENEEEFRDDVMLTFDNALKYNPEINHCYQAAVQLKKKFNDIWGITVETPMEAGAMSEQANEFYECDKCSKTFWWSAKVFDAMKANHARKHCIGSLAPSDSGSFKRQKDQGWGELLHSNHG